jgi:hypothetical protein
MARVRFVCQQKSKEETVVAIQPTRLLRAVRPSIGTAGFRASSFTAARAFFCDTADSPVIHVLPVFPTALPGDIRSQSFLVRFLEEINNESP